MSRFLEITVAGNPNAVAERAYRAFRTVGRVRQWEPEASLSGVIRVDGYPTWVTVTWKPVRDSEQVHVDISARSDDRLSQVADRALYRFVRAYRAVGWPDPAARPGVHAPRWVSITLILLLMAAIGFWRWTSVQ